MFPTLNTAYNRTFQVGKLSLGLVVPIERYNASPVPTMRQHLERVQLAEHLGFASVWLRDVPFNVPTFGDAGQLFDPFVYLGYLTAHTDRIALGVSSIILPLRHPAHIAKASASVDALSSGRLLLGIASGDRPAEYPAMNHEFHRRGEQFRASYDYIRAMSEPYPHLDDNAYGTLRGNMDMLPKPNAGRVPMLITGGSQQSLEWVATHGDGWLTYPRPASEQAKVIADYRSGIKQAGQTDKPVIEPLYIDLVEDDDASATPIHLGLRLGITALIHHLRVRQQIGVNHIALNLRFNQADIEQTLRRLANEVLGEFDH